MWRENALVAVMASPERIRCTCPRAAEQPNGFDEDALAHKLRKGAGDQAGDARWDGMGWRLWPGRVRRARAVVVVVHVPPIECATREKELDSDSQPIPRSACTTAFA